MPSFAANLSTLYPEMDFLDRFAMAKQDGFKGVEYLFPYAWHSSTLATRLAEEGLQQVLFNAPPGNWDKGERGLACLYGRTEEFQTSIHLALEYAKALACPRIHVMAGRLENSLQSRSLSNPDYARARETYITNLHWAANLAAQHSIDILIEPINIRDMPGYFLNYQEQAHTIIQELGSPNIRVQMDLYHCQIMEGDLATKIQQYLPTGQVGHIQIASVPERHEPDQGEVYYPYLFQLIDQVSHQYGWNGWLGCEYRPSRGASPGGTSIGLEWMRAWEQTQQK